MGVAGRRLDDVLQPVRANVEGDRLRDQPGRLRQGRRRPVGAGADPLRAEGHGRLRQPRPAAGQVGRGGQRVHRGRAVRHDDQRELRPGEPAGDRAGGGPEEPAGHGDARRGARRAVRQALARRWCTQGTQGRAGHPDHRPRPGRPARPARAGARGRTSRSTPTARCCRRTCTPSCASIPTWPATTAGPGRSRSPSSRPSPGRSWPRPTAS